MGDLLPLTKAEIFVGVWMKKLIFLPGNPFYPVGWHLPDKDMKDLASHIRKVGPRPLLLYPTQPGQVSRAVLREGARGEGGERKGWGRVREEEGGIQMLDLQPDFRRW